MAQVPKLTPMLAKRLYDLVNELGEETVSDEHGSVHQKVAAVWEVSPHAASSYLLRLEQLELIVVERSPTRNKIHRLAVASDAYQTAMKLATKREQTKVSKVAQRVDREMRSIPLAAASRLRLHGLRGDCRH